MKCQKVTKKVAHVHVHVLCVHVKKKETVRARKIASLEHRIFMFDQGTQNIPFTMKI